MHLFELPKGLRKTISKAPGIALEFTNHPISSESEKERKNIQYEDEELKE